MYLAKSDLTDDSLETKSQSAIFCKCTQSDSSLSDNQTKRTKRRQRKTKQAKNLPPIGVFWDIENCHVPKNRSAAIVVQRIREIFFKGYREAEFIVVCDVRKEKLQIIEDLNDAQVNLIHVSSTSKNAADEKLRQSIRRFAEIHSSPAAVVLITGDVNFAADLTDLRYRKKIHVILVHNNNVADALILCANETFTYSTITEDLPLLNVKVNENVDLYITNLPTNVDTKIVKQRLKFLSYNCGGRVLHVMNSIGCAVIRFSSYDFALRAQKRLIGEDVFGRKINVSNLPENRPNQGSSYAARTTAANINSNERVQNGKEPSNKTQYSSNVLKNEQIWPTLPTRAPLQNHDSASNFDLNAMNKNQGPYELVISNLLVTGFDIKLRLHQMLKQFVRVEHIQLISKPQETTISALVRVSTMRDVQIIFSKVHMKYFPPLSSERLIVGEVSHNENKQHKKDDNDENNKARNNLKDLVVIILKEKSKFQMPLFLLIEALSNRFYVNTSVSELNKLTDVCTVFYENKERIVALIPQLRISPTSNRLKTNMLPYCTIHCKTLTDDLFGEGIVCVRMGLIPFSGRLDVLLKSHHEGMPLLSFSKCYIAEFGENLPIDDTGVPLEHLVTCVENVKLVLSNSNKNIKLIKRVIDSESDEEQDVCNKQSTPLNSLKNKVIDLIKGANRCQIALVDLVPTYHHRFGIQMNISEYGFSKLIDLLTCESFSRTIQILGENDKRLLTFTHRYQKLRFFYDVQRILRNQNTNTLRVGDFAAAYEALFKKPLNPVDYGLCTLQDLFRDLPKNNVIAIEEPEPDVKQLAVPNRERTIEEKLLLLQFRSDVKSLLTYMVDCIMPFHKFCCAYQQHFGFQFILNDYGESKLMDLFEAISDTIQMNYDAFNERKIKLTPEVIIEVRGIQVSDLIIKSCFSFIPLVSLCASFEREYAFSLLPAFNCLNVIEIVSKLNAYIEISKSSAAGPLLILVKHHMELALRLWALLINPPHQLELSLLIKSYYINFDYPINILQLENLRSVQIIKGDPKSETFVKLTKLYEKAAKLYTLLLCSGGQVPFEELNKLYYQHYNTALFSGDAEQIFKEFSFMIIIRNVRKKTVILLNPKLTELGLAFKPGQQPELDTKTYPDWYNPAPKPVGKGALKRSSLLKFDIPQSLPNDEQWSSSHQQTENVVVHLPNMNPVVNPLRSNLIQNLLTPESNLMPAYPYPVVSPHPTALPIPDKLLKKDDSSDSGVHTSNLTSENEMEMSNDGPFKSFFAKMNRQEQK